MPLPVSAPAVSASTPGIGMTGKRRSASGAEQARRIQWGKQAGAQVAAAYRQMQKGRAA